MVYGNKGEVETHENQGYVEIPVVLFHVFGVVLHRISFVRGVEIKRGSSFLIGWRYIRRASWMPPRVSFLVLVPSILYV